MSIDYDNPLLDNVTGSPTLDTLKSGSDKINDAFEQIAGEFNSLGTAATRDVTASNTDTDTSRVMRPGNFGLGSVGFANIISDIDSPNTPSGIYRWDSSTIGTLPPDPGSATAGIAHIVRRSTTEIYQLSFPRITNKMFFREISGGDVAPWQELYHTGNLGESDTAWTTVTSLDNGWTGTVRYIKRGGMVTVTFAGLDAESATLAAILTLPSNYRPAHELTFASRSEGTGNFRYSRIRSGGQLDVFANGVAGLDIRGTITYPVLP